MVEINNIKVYDEPTSCAVCAFFVSGSSNMCHAEKGHCILFDEMHKCIRNTPSRCLSLFRKALKYPEGTKLIVVGNLKEKAK